MDRRYALQSKLPPRGLLTWRGLLLVHDSKPEMEFLLTDNVRVVECPKDIPPEQCLEIRYHPNLAAVQWPLTKEQFR